MQTCPRCGQTFSGESQFCPNDGTALVDRPGAGAGGDDRIGTLVDRYRLLALIGEGGMGTVYKAEHTLIGRPVALKLLRAGLSDSAEAIERFFREARAANEIKSEHIVQVTDFGQLPDRSNFLVMELLGGRSLRELIEAEAPLDLPRVARIGAQIADGLAAAHERSVVHRDLKPANIQLVQRDDDPEYVKLLDFGIAKISEGGAHLTKTGAVLGTPAYMSPEQASSRPVDPRTDIYALGVILYELLVGRPPFSGHNPAAVLVAHLTEPIPPPRAARPGLPEALEALVLACLDKDPDGRPRSMGELARRLRAWMKEAGFEGYRPEAPTGPRPGVATLPAVSPLKNLSSEEEGLPAMAATVAAGQAVPASGAVLASGAVQTTGPGEAAQVEQELALPMTEASPPLLEQQGAGDSYAGATVIGSSRSRVVRWLVLAAVVLAGGAGGTFFWLRGQGHDDHADDGAAGTIGAAKARPDASTARTDAGASKVALILPEPAPALVKAPGKRPVKRPGMKPVRRAVGDKGKQPAGATEAGAHGGAQTRTGAIGTTPEPKTPDPKTPDPKTPDPNAPPASMVRVRSIPRGAAIFDSFSSKGQAPLRFPTKQGFTLILKKEGFRPYHLDIKAGQTGDAVARLVPLPPHQRTTSFSRLNGLLGNGSITFSEWRMRRQALAWDRNKELDAIQQRFHRGEITAFERRQQVQQVQNKYR